MDEWTDLLQLIVFPSVGLEKEGWFGKASYLSLMLVRGALGALRQKLFAASL